MYFAPWGSTSPEEHLRGIEVQQVRYGLDGKRYIVTEINRSSGYVSLQLRGNSQSQRTLHKVHAEEVQRSWPLA